MSIRIYALAQQLKVETKKLLDVLKQLGIEGKGSSLASLTDEEVEKVKVVVQKTPVKSSKSGAGFPDTGFQRPPVTSTEKKIRVLDEPPHTKKEPPQTQATEHKEGKKNAPFPSIAVSPQPENKPEKKIEKEPVNVTHHSPSVKQLPEKGSSPKQLQEKGGASKQLPEKGGASKQLPDKGSSSKQLPDKGSSSKQLPDKGSSSKQLPDKGSS
ncbi:MAG: translation initiation factor IF-2 N-terminal domain-containing protein, partial [Planctomycetaceae bacterium]|nr:translation initiation factor IF-2 N-terminal domain-containing protein [Planctomycetaceae bacterium]